jgi:hypothetical protein
LDIVILPLTGKRTLDAEPVGSGDAGAIGRDRGNGNR